MVNWEAKMRCRQCTNEEEGRILYEMSKEEALEARLDCPSCELDEGLVVIESTLKRSQDRGN